MSSLRALVKASLQRYPLLDRLIRLRLLRQRARGDAYPDWSRLSSADAELWKEALEKTAGGPKVLMATSVGGYAGGAALESLLGAALTLRGARVHALLCDRVLPACFQCEFTLFPRPQRLLRHGPQKDLCEHCFAPAANMYESLGLPLHRYSQFLTAEDRKVAAELANTIAISGIASYAEKGVAVGEHAFAGALRFFARATLEAEPHGAAVLRRYFHAALLTARALRRLLEREEFEVAVFNHGIYVPQGLVGEVCRRVGVRVVNWNPAYRQQCFIFSHGDTYHHMLLSEPVSTWEDLPWTGERESELMDYLKSRWYGTRDWIWFHERPQEDIDRIAREVGVDFSRPCVGMLTNVMWDAQLHYPANAFPNMLEWVLETIRYFERRTDLQLLIRVHPAEVRGTIPSRQPIFAEIARVFPTLPSNVFLIPPESRVSTYAVMERCNAVIIYGTKTGVELTSMGIPVIVAGEAWIRNKGLTLDARSRSEYRSLLDGLPMAERLDEETTRRSRMYAYHFFFRRMILLEQMVATNGNPPFKVGCRTMKELLAGASIGLDVVCDGILHGTPFSYPAERLAATPPVGPDG